MPAAQVCTQEFYCSECQVYFLVTLFVGQTDYEVEVVCPNCGHQHRRCIHNGEIHEQGRFATATKERILSTKSTISKEPRTARFKKATGWGARRDGVPMDDGEMSHWLQQSWLERSAEEQGVRWDDDTNCPQKT